jgi:hypothetical protein
MGHKKSERAAPVRELNIATHGFEGQIYDNRGSSGSAESPPALGVQRGDGHRVRSGGDSKTQDAIASSEPHRSRQREPDTQYCFDPRPSVSISKAQVSQFESSSVTSSTQAVTHSGALRWDRVSTLCAPDTIRRTDQPPLRRQTRRTLRPAKSG